MLQTKMNHKNIKTYFFLLTLFVAGAVVMMVELLGVRILVPYYGSTLYVWSSLIAATLGFLALGYFIGGKLADKRPEINLLYLIIFLAGISIILIPKIDIWILLNTNFLGVKLGPLAASLILFSIPLFLLGMVAPFAVKIKTKELRVLGITAGSLYAISTSGSLAGTILTGFYLIPNYGLTLIINLTALALILISIIWFIFNPRYLRKYLKFFVLIALFFVPSYELTLPADLKLIYQGESFYGQIKVVDRQNLRFLLVNGATQTRYDLNKGEFDFPYLRLMEKAIKYHPEAKNSLVLGLGGGGIDKRFRALGVEVDNVEIDPKVVEVAREYFGFDGKVIIDDARSYIRRSEKNYDLVAVDVLSGYSVVHHLLTKEAFEEIKAILSEEGILTLNTLGFEKRRTSEELFEKALYKTLNEVFSYVYLKATGYGFQSIVFYASDRPLILDKWFISMEIFPDKETPILTDDYNPVETLTTFHVETFRKSTIEKFSEAILYRGK